MFADLYQSTAITLHADFTKLYVMAHLEAILNTIQWATALQHEVMGLITARTQQETQPPTVKPSTTKRRKSSVGSNLSALDTRPKRLKTKSTLAAIVEDQLSEMSKRC